jgi:dihydrofolate reductase
MKHFKRVTLEVDDANPSRMNAVIMGRKTWDSIDEKYRPLAGRVNVVLTRGGGDGNSLSTTTAWPDGVIVASSLEEAAERVKDCYKVFIIGGAQIYEQAISQGYVNNVIYTDIQNVPPETKFDTFFPELSTEVWTCSSFEDDKENGSDDYRVDAKSGLKYKFLRYTRLPPNDEEQQYLDLCREIIDSGIQRGDRTGTGTLSKFGAQMRFSLRDDTLPLLTTKRTFWRGVAEELLWFIQVRSFACNLVFALSSMVNRIVDSKFRATPTPRTSPTRTFTSGTAMARENSWTHSALGIEQKAILALCTGSSGVTLARNTWICTPTTPGRAWTSWRSVLTRSRTIRRIAASSCQLGIRRIWERWHSRRATCSANSM